MIDRSVLKLHGATCDDSSTRRNGFWQQRNRVPKTNLPPAGQEKYMHFIIIIIKKKIRTAEKRDDSFPTERQRMYHCFGLDLGSFST